MAVPGSVRSPASAGTNDLLRSGAEVACDVDDVLTAVELAIAGRPDVEAPSRRSGAAEQRGERRAPTPGAARVLRAVHAEPTDLQRIAGASGLGLGQTAFALEELRDIGLVDEERGSWTRRGRRS